jgi:hypothetical protein
MIVITLPGTVSHAWIPEFNLSAESRRSNPYYTPQGRW